MLKVPASGLATLVRAGLVTESFCVTRGKQLLRRYSRASVNALVSDLQQAVTSTDAAPKAMRQAMAMTRWPHADSSVAIIYVTRFKWNLVRLEGTAADWRDGLGIRDMDHFITEATRLRKLYSTQDVYLKRAEVLQILGCSYSALTGLESSGLVQPAKSPMKQARYVRAEIETFRKTYVLFDEVRKRCGLRGPKQIFFTLSRLGLKPLFDWGDKAPLVFHRARFDRVLKSLNLDQATQERAA